MRSLVLLLAILATSGCAGLSVRRLDPGTPHAQGPVGERVSLPLPAFLVKPKADGSLEVVKRVDLPDPTNTFAIDGWSVLARHTLVIKTDNGVLTQVRWNPDTTAVVSQAAKSAGNVAAEIVKAQHAEAKAAAAETKAQADAAAAAKKAKEKALHAARIDVEQKRIALEAARASGDSDRIYDAQVAYDQAQANLKAIEDAPPGVFNEPGKQAQRLAGWIPGPILFVIDETTDEKGQEHVRLVPAAEQQRATGRCDVSEELAVTATRLGSGDIPTIDVTFQCSIDHVQSFRLLDQAGNPVTAVSVQPRATDHHVLEIGLPKQVLAGQYRLQLTLSDGTVLRAARVRITVP